MPALQYIFTPALDTRIRLAWAQTPKRARTTAIDQLVSEIGWPRHIFKQRAQRIGATVERRAIWTAEQDKELILLLGDHSTRAIARLLHRSVDAIVCRASRLDMSARVSEGFSRRDLMRILGAPYHRVDEWIERGWLGDANLGEAGRIADEAVTAFIFDHMEEIDFRLADQTFLKGVLRDGKRKSVPRAPLSGAPCRGKKARPGSRRAARTFQLPLIEHCGYPGSPEMSAFLGEEGSQRSSAA